ncbi:MAG: hypothetical protein GWP59_07475 [Chlamydiales bacterium]|nr:FAD synthetase family protein [Chlamydiales bacterium]NCF71524.1 hypothetical protein [Chlamydiales bacterium]
MHIVDHTDKLPDKGKGWAFAFGSFDAFHLGHQHLINQFTNLSEQRGLRAALFTFKNHPRELLNSSKESFTTLYSLKGKLYYLSKTSLSAVITQEFTSSFAKTTYKDFIKDLCSKINLKLLVFGPDTSLGANREGNFKRVKLLGNSLNFETIQLDYYKKNVSTPSTTLIKEKLVAGELELIYQLLGRHYSLFLSELKLLECEDKSSLRFIYPKSFLLPPFGKYQAYLEDVENKTEVEVLLTQEREHATITINRTKKDPLPKGIRAHQLFLVKYLGDISKA